MFRYLFLVFILVLSINDGFGQLTASGNLPARRTVLLAAYKGDALTIVGSTKVLGDHSFSFPKDLFSQSGQYRIIYGNDLGVDFLYDRKLVEIEILDTISPLIFKDKLNIDFSVLADKVADYKTKISLLETILNSYPKESLYYKQTCKEWIAVQSGLNESIDNVRSNHQNDLLFRLSILWKVAEVDPSMSEEDRKETQKAHFFDHVNFNDTTLFYTNGYTLKVIEFLMLFTSDEMSPQEAQHAIINGLSRLDKVREGSPVVFAFITEYLIKGFEQFGFEDVLVFLAEHWNQDSCLEFESNNGLSDKLKQITKMKVGNSAPLLKSKTVDGTSFNISQVSSRFRLVLFWSSNCIHCKQILPMLRDLYHQQTSQEIEVIAFGLDRDTSNYLETVNNLQLNWINITDFKGFESPVVKEWGIVGTPSMFLLDNTGTILEKPQTLEDLKVIFKRMEKL